MTGVVVHVHVTVVVAHRSAEREKFTDLSLYTEYRDTEQWAVIGYAAFAFKCKNVRRGKLRFIIYELPENIARVHFPQRTTVYRGTLPSLYSLLFPPLPLEVGFLNPARGSGGAL